MKMNKYGMLVLTAALLSSSMAHAEEQKAAEVATEAAAAPSAAAAPAMDPAQMEKMKALMAPSAAHKTLETFVGKWNYNAKFWMSADSQPEETTGTSENSMIYGGRFLKQDIKGTWMNQPFEGTGFMGYDNIRESYQSIWIDSMGTGIMFMTGAFDAASNTLKETGKNSCPMTGEKEKECRTEIKIVDANQHVYSAYSNGPDGKEFKGMEIVYTKAA